MVDRSLYLSSHGADDAFTRQQIHANNLANSKTVGFKADKLATFSVPIYGDHHPSRVGSVQTENMVDLSQGNLRKTNNPLDMALVNEGFFVVQNMQGEQVLSRDGQFSLNELGQLVNQEGYGVLSANGSPIVIPVGELSATVGGLLHIQEPDGVSTEIQMMLTNPEKVSKRADGYFESAAGQEVVLSPEVRIEQGALEESNVNSMYEMVSLIDTARHYELALKNMQNIQQISESSSKILQM